MRADEKITTIAELEELYGRPGPNALVKELDHIHPHYRSFIERSPFLILATANADEIDVSPRGDPVGFVEITDERTLLLPDRPGNNRFDSLRNIIDDPRVGLLFLIPGMGLTIRVVGRAEISIDPHLKRRFAIKDKLPRSVLRIRVERVYFQCQKAIVRSGLWQPDVWPDISHLPTPGQILEDLSSDGFDGSAYDHAYPERMKQTIY